MEKELCEIVDILKSKENLNLEDLEGTFFKKDEELFVSRFLSNDFDGYVIKEGGSQKYRYKDWLDYKKCWNKVAFFNINHELVKLAYDVVDDVNFFTMGKEIKTKIKTIPNKELLSILEEQNLLIVNNA